MSGRRRALAVAVAVALVLGACGGGGGDDDAAPDESTTTAPNPVATVPAAPGEGSSTPSVPDTIRWAPCEGEDDQECATLTVPIDHFDPAGPTLDLALARIPATGDSLGTLLFNPGGPGASGIESLAGIPLPDEVRSRFDVTTWDPRGIGGSRPLRCGDAIAPFFAADFAPDTDEEELELQAAARAVADECAEEDGDVLAHLATADTVEDIEAIRAALGGDPLSYVGYSYGTFIGQLYAEAHPDGLRALVLDGVVDPALSNDDAARIQLDGIASALDDLLASCDDERCPLAPGAASAVSELFATVEVTPLDGGGGPVGPTEALIGTVLATYDPSIWPQYLDAVAAAEDGDGRVLRVLFESYLGLADPQALLATACLDEVTPEITPDGIAEQAFRIGEPDTPVPDYTRALLSTGLPCAYWPVPAEGRSRVISAPGAPPALVLGNTGDNATPYEASVAVAAALERATLLTLEGSGHTSMGRSPCIDEVVTTYLVDLELPPDGTRCG